MSFINFILAALAVYRLAYLISIENGPFMVFARLREFVGKRLGWDSWISLGLACPLCISFWLSLAAAWLLGGGLLEGLGIAGAILIVHKAIHPK